MQGKIIQIKLRIGFFLPSCCCAIFYLLHGCFASQLLGWPQGAQHQQQRSRIAGDLIAWAYKPECTECGVLHAHSIGKQPVMLCRCLEHLVKNPQLQGFMLKFLESICQQWLPSPYFHCPSFGISKHDSLCCVDHKNHNYTVHIHYMFAKS